MLWRLWVAFFGEVERVVIGIEHVHLSLCFRIGRQLKDNVNAVDGVDVFDRLA